MRKTEHFDEIYPFITDFAKQYPEGFKDTQAYEETFNLIDWIGERFTEYVLKHNGFFSLMDTNGVDHSTYLTSSAKDKIRNFFATLDEEGKAMVRSGKLLGEYRIEDYPLIYPANK